MKTNHGSKTKISKSHKIFILNKIPAKYIEATLAHELMHVWINENIDHKLSKQLEEGTCNFISYTYLKSDYSEDAQNIIKQMKDDHDPIYGDGFRKVYNNFKGKYLSELLNYLKHHKSL
ncbi:MAG: protein DA1 [Chlorobi bacterium]|nr:protein DA1 [Chlorobiota bacterium]